jgi:hypothetical protein
VLSPTGVHDQIFVTVGELFYFYFIFSYGVRLNPLGTAATVWPIVPAPDDDDDDDNDCGAIGRIRIGKIN